MTISSEKVALDLVQIITCSELLRELVWMFEYDVALYAVVKSVTRKEVLPVVAFRLVCEVSIAHIVKTINWQSSFAGCLSQDPIWLFVLTILPCLIGVC